MATLRMILGRAGAGKTYTCLSDIAAEVEKAPLGPPLIFLVPDQASFQAERALALRLPMHGFSRARVLSFTRLAVAILGEIGGLALPELSPMGRQMLLRALLLEHREQLQLFGQAARQPGFVAQLAAALQEMTRYNHEPGQTATTARRLAGTVLEKKLADLALLWEAFEKALANRQADADAYLKAAVLRGAESSLVKQAEIWVDGFAGFTPLEMDLLLMLVRNAKAVHLALCMDPTATQVNPLSLFRRTQATYTEVLLAAEAGGIPVHPPLLLTDSPRFAAPELRHLEAEFEKTAPQTYAGSITSIRVFEAVNRRAEVEAVGRDILRLCREKGYRFRDIAVITRDLTPYCDLLTAVFHDLGIPCFVDQRTSVAHHPLVELLRSGMEVVASRWDLRPLMRCLKTDLLPFDRSTVDALENYALEHGLHGSAWRAAEPWQYGLHPGSTDLVREQVAALDTARRKIVATFAPLQEAFGARRVQARAGCMALYRFLQESGVPGQLQEWANQSAASGALQDSLTHQQVWDACISLLEQLVEALGDADLTTAEFAQVMEAGLESLRLGLIPPALDQVLVGSVDRSRQPHLRAAYVLGVGERSFPAAGNEDSMFTDVEREVLAANGFTLGPTGTDQTLQEQYLGYIAFTRAAEYLVVSYPLAGDDGRALSPSPFIAKLRAAFPTLQPESVGNEPTGALADALPWLMSPLRLVAAAVRRLQPVESRHQCADWQAAIAHFGNGSAAQRVLASLQPPRREANLAPQTAAALAGVPLVSSISRLESFAACPFKHFAQHLLRLRERQEFRVQFTDIGLLVHETLHRFVRQLQSRQIDWATLADADANRIADALVDEVAPRMRSEVFMSSARYQYLVERMKRVLHVALWVWAQHAQRGGYRPVATELPFGEPAAAAVGSVGIPGLVIDLPGGGALHLHGRIDRVDICRGGESVYLRVIDYKGSGTSFSVIDVYHGLRLQLVVYLNTALQAARTGHLPGLAGGAATAATAAVPQARADCPTIKCNQVLPGGAYYFNVKEPIIDTTKPLEPAALQKELLKKMQVKGLTLRSVDAIRLAEADAEGQLIPARLTKAGEPYNNPLTVTQDSFEQLMTVAEERMRGFAGRILAGEVQAAPYRYPNGANACQFCPFHVVCHFDPQIGSDHYRLLEHRDNRRAWELLDGTVPSAISEQIDTVENAGGQ